MSIIEDIDNEDEKLIQQKFNQIPYRLDCIQEMVGGKIFNWLFIS